MPGSNVQSTLSCLVLYRWSLENRCILPLLLSPLLMMFEDVDLRLASWHFRFKPFNTFRPLRWEAVCKQKNGPVFEFLRRFRHKRFLELFARALVIHFFPEGRCSTNVCPFPWCTYATFLVEQACKRAPGEHRRAWWTPWTSLCRKLSWVHVSAFR